MPHSYADEIGQVVADVFEQMAFVFIDPAEEDEVPANVPDAVRVDLSFTGAADGSVSLLSTRELCEELAENLVGEDSEQAGVEALMELVNIISGQLLTAVAGTTPVFDLTAPVARADDQAGWHEARGDERAVSFISDDRPIVVMFDYRPAA